MSETQEVPWIRECNECGNKLGEIKPHALMPLCNQCRLKHPGEFPEDYKIWKEGRKR